MIANGHDENDEGPREEALHWFVRLHSGEIGDADRAGHASWMTANPRHRQEYTKLDELWSDLDAAGDPRPSVASNRSEHPRFTRRFLLAGGAGAVAASAAIISSLPDLMRADHTTGTGELRVVNLPDGSIAHLDAETAVAIDYGDRARDIELLAGRALFDVSLDPSRPFTVKAARGNVTAFNKRFVVHRWSDDVTVSVMENSVKIALPHDPPRTLRDGQHISYDNFGVGEVSSSDMDSETAWLRGKLIFEDRPLRQVLADVNRYRRGAIRVASDKLLDMRVSGIFDIRDPDSVLDAVTATLPVRSFSLSPYLIVLYSA